MGKDEKPSELVDAVAIGLSMQLPADVLAKHAVGRWVGAKLAGEHVDDTGQRWVTMSMPIGGRTITARGDTIRGVALVKQADGYSVVKLELPIKIAAQYAVETSDPEARGFAVDQAQRAIEEAANR